MSRREDIAQWVVAWGRQAGIDLAPDANGHFNFVVDGIPIRLSMEADIASSLLGAILEDRDLSASQGAMRALLEFAHLGVASQRCGVSLSDDGRPVLWLWLDWARLDAAGLTNTLNGFAATAAAGRQILAEKAAADHAAGGFKPHQMVQSDWMDEFGPLTRHLRV